MTRRELNRLVAQGEGLRLEFKRKARHPDKLAREIIAFANTEGGILLIGVDDNGSIYGSKTPNEDVFELEKYIKTYCRPSLQYHISYVSITGRHTVIVFEIAKGLEKPYFVQGSSRKFTYVRVNDMSIQASREMVQVLRHADQSKGVSIRFGDRERTILQYLEKLPRITLDEAKEILRIPRRQASGLLILLVRAGLLNIHPSQQGDYFTLSQEAFES